MQNCRLVILIWMSTGLIATAGAETICLNGGRGFILDGCVSGGAFGGIRRNRTAVGRLPGSGNVFSVNGRLFERDFAGRFRPLFVDRNTGQILGATRQSTLGDVLGFYQRNLNGFDPNTRGVVDGILRANGVNPVFPDVGNNQLAGFPGVGAGGNAGTGAFGSGAQARLGEHGNGTVGTGAPQPGGQRPPLVTDGFPGEVPSSACRDLNSAFCSGAASRVEEERQIDQRRRGLVTRFLQATRTPFAVFQQAMVFFQQEGDRVREAKGPIQLRDPSRFIGGFQQYLNFLNGQIAGARGPLENIRSQVVSAIEKQPLDPSTKEQMRNVIAKVKLVTTPNLNDVDSVMSFINNCGPDGMSPGAFAVKETSEVVICPGMIFQAAAKGQSLLFALGHVVGHELGHHIDAFLEGPGKRKPSEFNGQYARFEACLKETYPQYRPTQVDECGADHWGISSLVGSLEQQNASPEVAFQAIKAAVSPLCTTQADEEHPAGVFRIRHGVGRNPAVLKILGCGSPDPEKPGCTLEGKVPQGGI